MYVAVSKFLWSIGPEHTKLKNVECSYFPIEKSVITVRTYFIIYGLKLEEKYHFFKTNIRSLIWLLASLDWLKIIVFH